MSNFTPFNKELQDLTTADLSDLKDASEGWYIEYKSEAQNAKAIAKSVSAFANTYGGWLFFGIKEESKENPVAGAFPGVSIDDLDATMQRIRKAVADNINPAPFFETKVLLGPCEKTGLPSDRAVICVRIPWSVNAPHIHKSGVIYRRVSDASEPRPENDRFVLDQLWQRAEDLNQAYGKWHDRDPEFSEAESKQPYVRLMIAADLSDSGKTWLDAPLQELRSIFGKTQGKITAIPFDTVHTSAEGIICRQLKGNNPHNLTLTWHVRRYLLSDVIIPLPLYTPSSTVYLQNELNGYENSIRFVELLKRYNYDPPRIVDLNYLFNILIGVVEIQQDLITRAGWKHSYFVKAKLLNAWRTIPFIDLPSILDAFEKYGTPMCFDSEVTSPPGKTPVTFLEIKEYADVENEYARLMGKALLVFSPIAEAFGIPAWIDHKVESGLKAYYEELQGAGRRAMDVQKRRNAD